MFHAKLHHSYLVNHPDLKDKPLDFLKMKDNEMYATKCKETIKPLVTTNNEKVLEASYKII